jgi:hypothetical protein
MRGRSFLCLLVFCLVGSATAASDNAVEVKTTEQPGLRTVEFQSDRGTVWVNFPADMAAGDTLSGTVVASEDGKNEKQKRKNRELLLAGTISLGGREVSVGDSRFTLDLAADAATTLSVSLRDSAGNAAEVAQADLTLALEPPATPWIYTVPTVGQRGRPIQITGPFDGALDGSSLILDGNPLDVLAESPRGAVYRAPVDHVGAGRLRLDEGGRVVAEGDYHNVQLKLTAPKTRLDSGEATTLTVAITGLDAYEGDASMTVDLMPESVIGMEGGNHAERTLDTQEDDVYVETFDLTGRTPGAWNAIATVSGDERSYFSGRFALEIDGQFETYVRLVEAPGIHAELSTHHLGPSPIKLLDPIQSTSDSITFGVDLPLTSRVASWISAALEGSRAPQSGSIIAHDAQRKETRRFAVFDRAVVDMVSVPALGGTSPDPAYVTVRIQAEEVHPKRGEKTEVGGVIAPKTKKWLASNFRFDLGDLPCDRISKIDSISWEQKVIKDDVGTFREPTKEPASIEVPPLKLTISTADVAPWTDWARQFTIEGECEDGDGLPGSLELLGPDRQTELGPIQLENVCPVRFDLPDVESGKAERVQVELIVTKMRFTR